MKLVYVDKLPERPSGDDKCAKHDLLKYIQEFIDSGREIARVEVDPGEYCESHSCGTSFAHAIKAHKIGGVSVKTRCGQTYLVREQLNF